MLRYFASALTASLAAFAGAALLVASANASEPTPPPQPTERGVVFSGVDVAEGSTYWYDGVIVALNRDLGRDGWLLRAYGSRVDYDNNPGDGRGWQGDVMLGYQFTRGPWSASFFAGVDYQNFHNTGTGPFEVDGTEWGFKVAGDISTADSSPFYANLSGSYSTAFDSYWTRLRLGVNRDRITFGPEAIAMGNEGFDAQRLGAFITIRGLNPLRWRPFDVTLSGGHQFADDSGGTFGSGGGEGAYGAISFSMVF